VSFASASAVLVVVAGGGVVSAGFRNQPKILLMMEGLPSVVVIAGTGAGTAAGAAGASTAALGMGSRSGGMMPFTAASCLGAAASLEADFFSSVSGALTML
jgi:hypothetical protein